jgi:hypothetical protein
MDSEPGDHLHGDPIPRNAIYEALHIRTRQATEPQGLTPWTRWRLLERR